MRQCPPKELIKAGERCPVAWGAPGPVEGRCTGPPAPNAWCRGPERRLEGEGRGSTLDALRGDTGWRRKGGS